MTFDEFLTVIHNEGLFLDPGLLLAVLNLEGTLSQQLIESIMTDSPQELVNKGCIAEMVAGLEIMRNKPAVQRQKLYYWKKVTIRNRPSFMWRF